MTASVDIEYAGGSVSGRLSGPAGPVGILLAHGAGVGQDHPWMVTLRDDLAAHGLVTMTFNYAYTEAGRRNPDRLPRLLAAHEAAADVLAARCDQVVLAGKSMGGRVASHLVGDGGWPAAGLVYYGYPLVPMGKSDPRDTGHLERIVVPQLFFAGTRDRLSPPPLVEPLADRLADARVVVIPDGDHSFRPLKRTGVSQEEVLASLGDTTAEWVGGLAPVDGPADPISA